MSDFPAHVRKTDFATVKQSVEEHCRRVAELSASSLKSSGLYSVGYLAGIVHDCGKYTDEFARYITKAADGEKVVRGSVNHTFAGVIYMLENYHDESDAVSALTCEIIAYAVGAHHGLFDCVDLYGYSGFTHRTQKSKDEISYDYAVSNFRKYCITKEESDVLFAAARGEIQQILTRLQGQYRQNGAGFVFGLLVRTVLSALIDADRTDTAEFMSGQSLDGQAADSELWKKLLDNVERRIAEFKNDTPINRARAAFSEQCKAFAVNNGSGIYRLDLPTGGSKTLSSLRYALAQADTYNKKRVIFVIPLLSVLEQNSAVIRDCVKAPEAVLEHHSNVVLERDDRDAEDLYRNLTQTWDSPIVITTLVQLLNTVFSGKSADIRRMKALCDSVIIIDEIQSLPKKTIDMFNVAMNYLTQICGATVVLCSATQPDFEGCEYPLKLAEPCEIVKRDSALFDVFRRTKVIDSTSAAGMSIESLAEFTGQVSQTADSVLVICNTKSTASRLYDELKLAKDETRVLFHLSTSMCMKHRMNVMNAIISHLERQRKGEEQRRIICVATQLVEAGVDFSFQSVIRVRAGIDSVAQAAGRCNRNGEYGELCQVYIVNLDADAERLGRLAEIKSAADVTTSLLYEYRRAPEEFDNDILGGKSIENYYKKLFSRPELRNSFGYPQDFGALGKHKLFDLLGQNLALRKHVNFKERYVLGQSFKTAGDAFKVFDDDTVDVLVPYDDEAKETVADLCSQRAEYDYAFVKETLAKAQRYTVKLFRYQFEKLWEEGLIYFDKRQNFAILHETCYDAQTGFHAPDITAF